MAFTRTQAGVAAGMAGGFAATIAIFVWPALPHAPGDIEGRIGLWLACALIAGAWLLLAVAMLARHRFFTPEDMDGGGLTEGTPTAKLLQTLIQNTLEQCMLAIPAYGAWLWLASPDRRGLVVPCVASFALGRLLFFAGYARGAPFRALGFTLTFYPTVGLYLFLLPPAARLVFS